MNKLFLGLVFAIGVVGLAQAGGPPINEQIDNAIRQSQEAIEQNPEQQEPTEVIQQQQQILERIDELDNFKSLEKAREVLKELNKNDKKYLK